MSVDMQRVTVYNEKLKKAKDECSKLASEIEFDTRELNRLCTELSSELGEDVNSTNIAEIYARELQKIEKTLDMGEEILERIAGVPSNKVEPVNDTFNVNTGVNVNEGVNVNADMNINAGVQQELEKPIGDFGNLFGNLA